MVSSEGACAAYYLYRRMNAPTPHAGRATQEEVTPVA
jgi:hydrogenase expression/formation protein HypD